MLILIINEEADTILQSFHFMREIRSLHQLIVKSGLRRAIEEIIVEDVCDK